MVSQRVLCTLLTCSLTNDRLSALEITLDMSQESTSLCVLATFEPLIGRGFSAVAEGVTFELQLVEAKALKAHSGAPRQEPFSLLFRASKDCVLGQGVLRLSHEQLGSIDVFLVPVQADESSIYYESIFN